MDVRKEKTIQRIKNGFKELIQEKNYRDIKVQDILDKGEIGRTTFYEHYKSKDEVLKSIVLDIFIHINHPIKEINHDYSGDNSLLQLILHMLKHFEEEKSLLRAILNSESRDIFLKALSKEITSLIEERMIPYYTSDHVPEDVLLNHLSTSLLEIILWWLNKDCAISPSDVAYYYFSLVLPSLKTKDFTIKIEKSAIF